MASFGTSLEEILNWTNRLNKQPKRRHPILFLLFYEILLVFVFPICFHKKKPKYLIRCFFAQFSIVIWFLSVKPWKHYLELFSAALCYYNKGKSNSPTQRTFWNHFQRKIKQAQIRFSKGTLQTSGQHQQRRQWIQERGLMHHCFQWCEP